MDEIHVTLADALAGLIAFSIAWGIGTIAAEKGRSEKAVLAWASCSWLASTVFLTFLY